MSAILRLYPRAWRERYGDELSALLEDHPASLLDQLDLIRGALDARLHPQVPGTDVAPEPEIPMNQRLLGIAAAIGGVAWIVGVATMFVLDRDSEGNRDASVAIFALAVGIALIGIALGGLGTRPASRSSAATAVIVGAISVLMALTAPWPWPLFILALLGFPILTVVAALRGTTNGTMPPWIVLAFTLAAVAVFAVTSGGIQTDTELVLFTLPGLAALLLAWTAFTSQAPSPEVRPA